MFEAGSQAETIEAARSGSELSSPDGVLVPAAQLFRSLAPQALRAQWQAAAGLQKNLPPFDELSLDGRGGLGENVALIGSSGDSEPVILRAGKGFESWLGRPANGLAVSALSIDRKRALQELYDEAAAQNSPVQSVAYGVVDGLVCVYDLVALPLSSTPQTRRCMVYIQERQQSFSLVETIFQATDDGLLALAVIRDHAGVPSDFVIAALNQGAARIMQGTVESLRGQRLSDMSKALQSESIFARILSIFTRGGRERFELECPLDHMKHLRVGVVAMGDLVAITLTDISAIKAQENSFRLLFDSNPVPMWVHCTKTLRFLAVNDAALALYGYSRNVFLSMTLLDIVPPGRRDAVKESILNHEKAQGEFGRPSRYLTADGSLIDVLTSSRPISFQGRLAQLAATMDVTEKCRAEARIIYMARHDALTGLANRTLFHERLEEAIGRVRRGRAMIAIHCLDLDRFKEVNDTLGHPAGDKLLVAAASRLRSCVRESEVVARLGGDEFAILQLGLKGPHEASALAERIEKVMSEPYEIDGREILTGASAGVALAPADGESADQLLKNADMALYQAKESGRNTFRFFEPSMDARLRARQRLERDLRNALHNGEFELFYQPLVSFKTGAISGFEALLRWRSPERGLVSPAEFIPLAEETGLIVPLGEWVLRQACAEAVKWPGDLRIAVNLSPVQFKKGNLPQVVCSTLASAGLLPERLELEITESVLLEESKSNLATLRHLRALGVAISMDDFGTGYSSLSYLRSFPFDKIKIDRSFVAGLTENGECKAIVRAITRLALNLGIPTLAEGVETEAQRELLRHEGCAEMQGYVFCKPVPSCELPGLLAEHFLPAGPGDYQLSA